MGCKQAVMDAEMKNLVGEMTDLIKSRSLVQYRINQLKSFNEQKSAFPSITEVKETQLLLIKLEKEINDTENLLHSIKGSKEEEHLEALEDTYSKLNSLLEQREIEVSALEQDVQKEAELNEQMQKDLVLLKNEGDKLRFELFTIKESANFRMLRKLSDEEEEINRAIKENEERKQQLLKSKFEFLANRRSSVRLENSVINLDSSFTPRQSQVPRFRLAPIDLEKSILAKSSIK